ncbi:MAG: hypothetical protein M3442_02975 [Chloroflexota bacterium]|nr:hypothetical protein [Chloroflexota bacterium]
MRAPTVPPVPRTKIAAEEARAAARPKRVSQAETDVRALLAVIGSPLFRRMLAVMLAPAVVVIGAVVLLRLWGVL